MDDILKDKVPPHNIEAEQALLGAILLDSKRMTDVVAKLRPEKFYSLQNQLIYAALEKLNKQDVTIDSLALINELTIEGKLEQAGGAAYIASLTDVVPSAANIEYYAGIVVDRSIRRELIKISSEVKASAFEIGREGATIVDEAE